MNTQLSLNPHSPLPVTQDSVLVSLANILQNCQYSNDAILVTSAALDVASDLPVAHFTMANIYAAKVSYISTQAMS